MEFVKIIALSLGSIVTLFVLSKLMGNKEMSQLSMFDYIIGITIGSIASELSTSLESNFLQPLTAMIVYAIVSIVISIISNKSLKFRRFLLGNSLILLDNGELYRRNFKKAKLDLNEFLMQCRTNGYFNLSDLQTVILETNGKLSFLPKTEARPTTPADLNLTPNQERITINLILDGQLLYHNLTYVNHDELWLQKQLSSQKINSIQEVFLAICDSHDCISVYLKRDLQNSENPFQ